MSKDCSENSALTYACRNRMVEIMVLFIEIGGKDVVLDIIGGFDKCKSIEDFLQEKESLSQSDIDELVSLLLVHDYDSLVDY